VAEVDDGVTDLVRAAQAGDASALQALLERYEPQIYRFGMKMCGDPEDARDVLQETLFAAARAIPSFRGASSVTTWLYAIARSFCIKKRRRGALAPDLVSLDADGSAGRTVADGAADPEQSLARREIADALAAAIAALDPEHREVLLLRDVEGLRAADVAAVTGLSVAAVKSRLHRARVAVRERLAPFLATATAHQPPGGAAPCPDVATMLSGHLEGEISAASCAEMERHVATCARCAATCESLRETLRLCRATPTPSVPEGLQASIRRGIRELLAG
jgi:RNA polymerase sigma-70 factor, ECF subfamily